MWNVSIISLINFELFCDIRYNRIMKETDPPLIPSPLPIIPELQHFLESARTYLSEKKICRDLLSLKRKELAFILGYFYSDYDLSFLGTSSLKICFFV